jgi:hypothetical protein
MVIRNPVNVNIEFRQAQPETYLGQGGEQKAYFTKLGI